MSGTRCAGFTLVETIISLALVGLVITKLALVMDEARRAHQDESIAMALDDQAMELIDRISFALVGAARQKLTGAMLAPLTSAEIHYQVSMGIEDGQAVWSDPEVIGMKDEGSLYWAENPGEVNERLVVWANTVSQMLQNELANGIDDNGNDLADELGLSFVLDGRSVTIRLSLERLADDGKKVQSTKETTVTCRN